MRDAYVDSGGCLQGNSIRKHDFFFFFFCVFLSRAFSLDRSPNLSRSSSLFVSLSLTHTLPSFKRDSIQSIFKNFYDGIKFSEQECSVSRSLPLIVLVCVRSCCCFFLIFGKKYYSFYIKIYHPYIEANPKIMPITNLSYLSCDIQR